MRLKFLPTRLRSRTVKPSSTTSLARAIANVTLTTGQPLSAAKTELAGVPKLDIRKVQDTADGLVPMKKKGEEEQTYFVGKAKGKKGSKTDGATNSPSSGTPSNGTLNIPLSNLSALLSFNTASRFKC
jgi:hypothetical protein